MGSSRPAGYHTATARSIRPSGAVIGLQLHQVAVAEFIKPGSIAVGGIRKARWPVCRMIIKGTAAKRAGAVPGSTVSLVDALGFRVSELAALGRRYGLIRPQPFRDRQRHPFVEGQWLVHKTHYNPNKLICQRRGLSV